MNISIIGTGYVGLVTGLCLAADGNIVMCCDSDNNKIEKLRNYELPIYEPGLKLLLEMGIDSKRLLFTTSLAEAVQFSQVIYITVSTPEGNDGSCDLKNVLDVIKGIAGMMSSYKLIIQKSTVPVGTGKILINMIDSILKARGESIEFDIASNPEFLREGSAVFDFQNPDRIVIGSSSVRAIETLKTIYERHLKIGVPLLVTNIETSEMVKYASNAFLAAKISFINEIANICELYGADCLEVAKGMGMDRRIGDRFLSPGPGFGGSCFPKDVNALVHIGKCMNYEPGLIQSILETNHRQKSRMVEKVRKATGSLEGITVSILGISFKPGTDDTRDSPAISIITELLMSGASIKAYDPKAKDWINSFASMSKISTFECPYAACEDSDCVVLVTEWEELSHLDFDRLYTLVKSPVFLDLRNIYKPDCVKAAGFYYEGVGVK